MRLASRPCRRRAGVAAALAAALAAACATSPRGGAGDAGHGGSAMRVDETANGSEVRVQVGQPLEVVLSETRSTGYRWEVVSGGAPVCRLERDDFEAPGATPGAPGRHTWVFSAAQAGEAVIALAYRRPFGGGEPARQFTVRVIAR